MPIHPDLSMKRVLNEKWLHVQGCCHLSILTIASSVAWGPWGMTTSPRLVQLDNDELALRFVVSSVYQKLGYIEIVERAAHCQYVGCCACAIIVHAIAVDSIFWSILQWVITDAQHDSMANAYVPHNSALLVWKVGNSTILTRHELNVHNASLSVL